MKSLRWWEVPMFLFIIVSMIFLARPAHAISGAQAYCICQKMHTLATCMNCCETECEANLIQFICRNQCQANCKTQFAGGPAPLTDSEVAACVAQPTIIGVPVDENGNVVVQVK